MFSNIWLVLLVSHLFEIFFKISKASFNTFQEALQLCISPFNNPSLLDDTYMVQDWKSHHMDINKMLFPLNTIYHWESPSHNYVSVSTESISQ